MSTVLAETFTRIQNIIEYPRNKQEEVLSRVLNAVPEEQFHEAFNVHFPHVTPAAVRAVGLSCFDKIDTRPNPPDGHITIDEVAECIGRTTSPEQQAVMLYIWLNFESIKEAHEDFDGLEKCFDYVLTRKDFENYVG